MSRENAEESAALTALALALATKTKAAREMPTATAIAAAIDADRPDCGCGIAASEILEGFLQRQRKRKQPLQQPCKLGVCDDRQPQQLQTSQSDLSTGQIDTGGDRRRVEVEFRLVAKLANRLNTTRNARRFDLRAFVSYTPTPYQEPLVVLLCPPRVGGLWSRLPLRIRLILEQSRRPWPLKRKRRCFRY